MDHTIGKFGWTDIITTDVEATKNFFSTFFGWAPIVLPSPCGPFDAFAYKRPAEGNEKNEAFAGVMSAHTCGGGLTHSRMVPYINVENLKQALEAAVEHGGKVVREVTVIDEIGQFAFVVDPLGAAISLWQSHPSHMPVVEAGANSICWHDMEVPVSEDDSRLEKFFEFYKSVCRWSVVKGKPGRFSFSIVDSNGKTTFVGGLQAKAAPKAELTGPGSEQPEPAADGSPAASDGPVADENCSRENANHHDSHALAWVAYIPVQDIAAAIAKVSELGGKLVEGPVRFDGGEHAVLHDPAGTPFGVVRLDPSPEKRERKDSCAEEERPCKKAKSQDAEDASPAEAAPQDCVSSETCCQQQDETARPEESQGRQQEAADGSPQEPAPSPSDGALGESQ